MQVLVVEHDSLERNWLEEVLEEAGFQVLSAATANAALEVLSRAHDSISAVVTEVRLPGSMDGPSLARAIRDRWPHIGVIFLSGFSHCASKIPKHARLLQKPVSEDFLRATIHWIVNAARRSKELGEAAARVSPASACAANRNWIRCVQDAAVYVGRMLWRRPRPA